MLSQKAEMAKPLEPVAADTSGIFLLLLEIATDNDGECFCFAIQITMENVFCFAKGEIEEKERGWVGMVDRLRSGPFCET